MKHGFSLVELSIVLVILGLLTGGILAGQSLIHAAELRAISTEYNKLQTATQTFRDKYFALPGDMTNATSFWGKAHATPTTCATTVSTGPTTCDGNGDGNISSTSTSYESPRALQHMANAGLIEGTYGGTGSEKSHFFASKFSSDAQWDIIYRAPVAANSNTSSFGGSYGNMFVFNGYNDNALNPEDAWSIDTKMDDGAPGTGAVISYKGASVYPCTSRNGTTTDTGATYSVNLKGLYCYLWLKS